MTKDKLIKSLRALVTEKQLRLYDKWNTNEAVRLLCQTFDAKIDNIRRDDPAEQIQRQ